MQAAKIIHRATAPATAPAGLREALDWRFFLAAFLAWAATFGIRMLEADTFLVPQFLLDGERLLATHDGYAFLAGAKGVSRYVLDPLADLVGLVSSVTGAPLGDVGFWLPPLFAGLAGVPVCLAAARTGRPEAGAAAGLLAASCFAFFIRSRFGFLDTDVLSLFFAYGTAAGFVLWLAPQCRRSWLPDGEEGGYPPHLALLGALALGLFVLAYLRFYPSGRPIVLGTGVAMTFAGLVLARPGNRTGVLLGLAVVLGIMNYPLPAVAAALLLAGAAYKRPDALLARRAGTILALAALAVLAVRILLPNLASYYNLMLVYLDITGLEQSADVAGKGLTLPSVISSVREVARAPFGDVLWLMAGKAWLFWPAMAGYLLAVWRRPLLLAFAPTLALGLMSPSLGTRFAMYGSAALGLGLALLVADAVALATDRRAVRLGVQGVLFAALAALLGYPALDLPPSTVVSPVAAKTFEDLRDTASKDAILWQWWDFGYAAQYFAERDTFGDGGRHSGDWIYPLALAHSTTSVTQAANIIRFTAADIEEQRRLAAAAGVEPTPPAKLDYFGVDPVRKLSEMGGAEADDFVQSLRTTRPDLPVTPPEQYLVVVWENMSHLRLVSRFGNWSLERGRGVGARNSPVPGGAVDFTRGILRGGGGQTAKLSGMTRIDKDGRIRTMDWMRFGAPYAVANQMTGELYVMESRNYNSMMVRMLLGDPAEFAPDFTLVVDNAPWARAYRVN